MSPSDASRWRRLMGLVQPATVLETFIIFNLGFLALDVFLAHRLHLGAPPGAWVPFAFSLVSPFGLMMAAALRQSKRRRPATLARGLSLGIGALSCVVGAAGLVLHLESGFFQKTTLEGLVYSAPFSAPLAYSGLGLAILLNRMVSPSRTEWARWVLALAAGGFAGNFVLALADHAQNGFFFWTEWIAVAVAALGWFLCLLPMRRTPRGPDWSAAAAAVALNLAAGLLGFVLHLGAILEAESDLVDNVVYGAPIFAPLLFVDVALLAAIGLWARWENTAKSPTSSALTGPPLQPRWLWPPWGASRRGSRSAGAKARSRAAPLQGGSNR